MLQSQISKMLMFRLFQVHTGTYKYVQVRTGTENSKLHLIMLHLPYGACEPESQQNAWLGPFSLFLHHCSLIHSHSQTTQASPNLLWNDFSIFFVYACTSRYIAVCTSMHCNIMEHFWYEPACSSTY
jgi:hypothetical protein